MTLRWRRWRSTPAATAAGLSCRGGCAADRRAATNLLVHAAVGHPLPHAQRISLPQPFLVVVQVYNLTHYLPYHPGGASILMSVAGKDGTVLFNK